MCRGLQLADEQYHSMPKLFELDDYEQCLTNSRGVFCLGTFDLLPYKNDKLLETIKIFSSNKYHFNHTLVHRGFCLPNRCGYTTEKSPKDHFANCVDNITKTQYGLKTNLTDFDYCKEASRTTKGKIDVWDIVFACVTAAILFCCLVGTVYEVIKRGEKEKNRYLVSWSVITNWKRLVADYADGDPRLSALKPIQGMKSMTLLLVMLAHSVFAYHIAYVYNPQFLEKASHDIGSAYFQNGTNIVQTFFMVSSFLFTYNLLLFCESNKQKQLSLKMLPKCLMHRVVRITPVYMFVLGAASTWLRFASDGPLWSPLIEAECTRCRQKLWSHALYISNFYKPDLRCFIHTWFLAVDMQLYVVCAILVLSLGRWPRAAMKVTVGFFIVSIMMNFVIINIFDLKPMVALMFPEYLHVQFLGEKSFKWLYAAPWDSLPSALVGVFVAFRHYTLQQDEYKPDQSKLLRILYRLSVPAMFLWVLGGYFLKSAGTYWVAVYAAVDRPLFTSMCAFAMYGFINKIDFVWWKFLSWRGFEILGRMSLSVYLVHWLYGLMLVGMNSHLLPASIHDIGGHFLYTSLISYLTAIPLYILVELPLQKFSQAFFT
ncbi:hypothetical protein K1T71_011555 [Dendrolimus kikuchii]|uniref:Uncharacterized protein n=1 Tax=Dendrolimus kikuchii TaxID=765133 RepID=A0ACC1CPP7_9NEOP|nr:hypothetical protein K1T71_011555 [Dendrolimus kikuchii]